MLGVIGKTKALFAGRWGAPLLQPYFDLWKLARKDMVLSETTTWVFLAGPLVGFAVPPLAALFIPFGALPAPVSFNGDLASIGMAEIMHCANRGENITTIFVNNTVYGMTGGQMAPTTLVGQKTTTCPGGRCSENEGMPIRMTEIIASLGGVAFAERVAVNNIKNIKKARKAVTRAFEYQTKEAGFSFVEILATCPTNWRMTPLQANKRVETEMIPYFPLGNFKDVLAKEEK